MCNVYVLCHVYAKCVTYENACACVRMRVWPACAIVYYVYVMLVLDAGSN